ncbi:hybrid sensor histidine kinase/response regulator [Leptolyngbya sp. NK1-12]|uniref:Circadian input-output histidine kinase CikA n=1 Tax=Leptolyngbya sp. NK1-12 TaxID=2547451 RepID=A0AA97AH90_9CYAN|nr:HAMP domain-containing sensor histidine kinase [Leptolyngbya sp. NK1-12]WNZ25185.1 hybrid sensor histidine kinase/response regulator [Leptolyngbya sp. NK1-12]
MLRVLIIDNKTNVKTLQSSLHLLLEGLAGSDLPIETIPVSDLATALAQLEHHSFDCVLWHLPQSEAMSLQLLHEVKTTMRPAPIVVLISDCADSQLLEQWREAGVWDVLPPSQLTSESLSQTLRCVMRVRQAEQQYHFASERLRRNDQLLWYQQQKLEKQDQQIRQLQSQLVEATKVKGQFLAMVSHELRTPMNAILGFSKLLWRTQAALSARQRDMVERILANAEQLMAAIDQILNFSKIEAGQLELHPEALNLAHLIRAMATELAETATQKDLALNLQLDLADPIVVTDPTSLQQVIFNLIANALKFTATGSVTIEAAEVGADRIAIVIRDTGIGIESAELDHIFEPFRQVDQSNTRHYRGIGLGLAVTAALVQQLEGTITVKSQVGQGSEFRIELPRRIHQSNHQPKQFKNSVSAARLTSSQKTASLNP